MNSCISTKKNSEDKILGKTDVQIWLDKSGWDKSIFDKAEFSASELDNFKKSCVAQNAKFIIFASSQCKECASSLPYFFKLLISSEYDKNKISLYGVDDYWEEPSGMYKKYRITELPVVFIETEKNQIKFTKSEFTDIKIILSKINGQ